MNPRRRVGGPGLQVVVGPVPSPGGSGGVLLCLLLATLAPPATANPTDSWADLPDAIAGRRESATDAPQPSAARPTLAGGVTPVVLTLNLEAYTESWMTPEGLPYEDHLEFDTRITGTVTLSPGRAEGDQWVATEGHCELNTHLPGTATRENWLWHETTIHNFDSLGEFYSAPGPPAPCDARLALRDGKVDEFFLSLPSSPANENAHVYAIRYSRAKAQAEVWIRLPPPFRYPQEYHVWEIPGTVTAANVDGSVTGAVVDSRGQPVAGAQVSFAGTPLTTDAVGQFRVTRVAPGPLRITVAKPGFESYDRTASMPAFLAVAHAIVLKEQEPVGSPLVIAVVVTNPPDPLLPGSVLPVTLVLSNPSADVVAGVGTFQLDLASSDVPSVEDVRLEQLDLAVNLPAGGQQSHDLTLRIPAAPSEARGGLGPRRVLARLTGWSGWPDPLSATPWAVSSCFWVGEVLVVMTHGFNPYDPWGDDHVTAWEEFRQASRDILGQMAALPVAGSALEHRVRPYVTMRDSSSGFWPAFVSLFFAKSCEAVAWNAFIAGKPADVLVATVMSQVLRLVAIAKSQESRYLAAVAANLVDRGLPESKILIEAMALYVTLFMKTDFSGWLPAAGVREMLHLFDIRAPNRAAYDFRDHVLPGHGVPSKHLNIQTNYLDWANELPGTPNFLPWNSLGGNRATSACAGPDYDRPVPALASAASSPRSGGPLRTALDAASPPAAGLHDLTFAYTRPEAMACEVQMDNVAFRFAPPRLRLERGEVEFDWTEDNRIEARFWGARIDF
ncbi:MAG: carboxypeptidase regulatory-like domain-containing protein [Verrucomicrobiales bacterium]|nr:carboxypeptidase regulatory-like domain-containing protein [Verrucomicrobiales bacterium]